MPTSGILVAFVNEIISRCTAEKPTATTGFI
jgi:hypothetical protein